MNLINELKAKSNGLEQKREEIVAEILSYFDDKLTSDSLENYLKKRIGKIELENRKVVLYVHFWAHHDGCSDTNFRCGHIEWHNPEHPSGYESRRYKDVELSCIDREIGTRLSLKLIRLMEDIGFDVQSREMKVGRLGYYHDEITFNW